MIDEKILIERLEEEFPFSTIEGDLISKKDTIAIVNQLAEESKNGYFQNGILSELQKFLKEKIKYNSEQAEIWRNGSDKDAYFREKKDLYMDRANIYGGVMRVIDRLSEESNNGWIPCSERLPRERDWYLAVFQEVDTGFIGLPYIADYLMGKHTKFTTEDGWIIANCTDIEEERAEYYKKLKCIAWQPLPPRYEPKGGVKDED